MLSYFKLYMVNYCNYVNLNKSNRMYAIAKAKNYIYNVISKNFFHNFKNVYY